MSTAEKLSITVYRATFGIASHMMNIAIDNSTTTTRLAYEFIFYESRVCYLVPHATLITLVDLAINFDVSVETCWRIYVSFIRLF
jgi:hypothetical protein